MNYIFAGWGCRAVPVLRNFLLALIHHILTSFGNLGKNAAHYLVVCWRRRVLGL